MVKRNENMSVITVNQSEKAQVGLKTKQPRCSLSTEAVPEILGQRKVESKRKGKETPGKYQTKENQGNILINQT